MKENTMQDLILFDKEELLESMDNDTDFMYSILDETTEELPSFCPRRAYLKSNNFSSQAF